LSCNKSKIKTKSASQQRIIDKPSDSAEQIVGQHSEGISRDVDDDKLTRAIAWTYYYLGVCGGMSAALDSLKSLNQDPLKDLDWQNMLRSYLPSQLAALRQPHADRTPAAEIIVREFEAALHKTIKRV